MSKKGKSNPVAHPLALPVDYKLREYRIIEVLGKGGFGITYLAEDLNLGKKVAVKELLPDGIATRGARRMVVPQSPDRKDDFEWARGAFIDEARILADLQHPNIVGVMRLLEANGTAYMVMEYVEGEPLRERIKRHEPPAQVVVDDYLRAILSGLRRVHERDLLHRDIKPENILIRGSDRQPVLIDFGAARGRASGQSQHVTSIVSPGYSPWEQYSTEISLQGPWSDIYALAAVVYHWIAGERPPESPQRVSRINREEPDPYVSLSSRAVDLGYDADFLAAIDAALIIRETDRPQTVAEWELDLGLRAMSAAEMETQAMSSRESASGRTSSREEPAKPVSRPSRRQTTQGSDEGIDSPPSGETIVVAGSSHRWLAGALVTALIAIAALLAVLIKQISENSPGVAPTSLAALVPTSPADRGLAPGISGNGGGEASADPDKPSENPSVAPVPEKPVEPAPPPPPPPPLVTVTTTLRNSQIEEGTETVFEVVSKGGALTEYPIVVSSYGLNIAFQRAESGEATALEKRYFYRIVGETAGSHTIPSVKLRAGSQEIETDAEPIEVTKPAPPPPPPPPPKTKEEIVRETLLSYLAAGGSGSSEDQNDYHASSVSYFGTVKSRYQIEQEYQEYRRRWPIRSYEVNGAISLSGYSDSWTAEFRLDYRTGDGIILKDGSAEKRYVFRFSGDTLEITTVSTIREISSETNLSKAGYESIIRFIDLFCEAGSSNYTGSVPRGNLYDDRVDYFDKNLSRAGVINDQTSWNDKFYSHLYRRSGDPSITDLKARKIQITFPMTFESNGPKGSKTGQVEVILKARYSDNAESMWIYYEDSRKL